MIERLPAWAGQYVGIPYAPRGRTRDGIDCWGIIHLVWHEQFGLDLPAYEGPPWNGREATDPLALGAAVREHAKRFGLVLPGSERLGDGILFRMLGEPLHVGLVLAPGVMLHAHEGGDSAIESYRSIQWLHRVLSFHRHSRLECPTT